MVSRAAGLFLFLTGGTLIPVGAVLYVVPWPLATAGLYLFCLGLVLMALALATSLPVILPARLLRLADLAEAALYSLLVGLLLLAVYRLVAGHPVRRDYTREHGGTLTPQSRALLGRLAVPVRATAFLDRRDPRNETVRALITEYQLATPLFTGRVLDPQERPSEVTRLGVAGISCIVLEAGTRAIRVRQLEEPHLTAGIVRATRPPLPIGFLSGHKERELKATARDQLAGVLDVLELENIEPTRVTLAGGEKIPEELRALVVPGPKADLTPADVGELERLLARGRGLLIALDLAAEPQPNLLAFLKARGLVCEPAMVLDMDLHAKNDAATLLLEDLPSHPITRGVAGLLLPGARPVSIEKLPDGATADTLARTSEKSWAELDAPREFAYTAGRDVRGPVPLAQAVQLKSGRLLVVGNALFMTDLSLGAKGNRDFLVNALAWVAEAGELPGIVAESRAERLLVLSSEDLGVMAAVTCIGMPITTLLVGMFLWLYRR